MATYNCGYTLHGDFKFAIFFFANFEFTSETKKLKGSLSLLEAALVLLPSALAFSVVKDVFFDLTQNKYKEQYCVGPIKWGKWKNLPKIDYVSVFKQPKEDGEYIFETNLWYQKNRHFKIYENSDLASVFEMGVSVAKLLHVDLLDATEPNNYKWKRVEDMVPK
ncbi:hypothetical protein [Maribacter halichondriae]|uniref:hypothetical protein n=1 Tax=Maribacter halichondriae TaxID=2980554 RepID=UPI002359B404|nr:hypothetical protein [Maribacter sp. Hal144]